jgi:hypothetical protein
VAEAVVASDIARLRTNVRENRTILYLCMDVLRAVLLAARPCLSPHLF